MGNFLLPPGFRATDGDDNPLANGYYRFYAAGTSTPKVVYSDADLSTSLGSQVNLNSAGTPVSGSNTPVLIYFTTGDYKVELYDVDDNLLFTFDDLPGAEEETDPVVSSLPETPVVSKTTTYSVVEADQGKLFNLNPTGGAFAVTLPSAVSVGDNFKVGFRHNGTANTATILTTLSQTIRRHKNAQAWTLKSQGECFWLVSDGSGWTVDSYAPPLIDAHNPFITIVDRLAAPPTNPTGGARYLINDTPTGVWLTLGFANKDIAEADGNGSWIKYTPVNGWLAYVQDEQLLTQYRGSAWTDLTNITAPTATTLKAAVFEDQKSNGTVGGTATTGAWTARTINTQVSNTITGVSLATDQITLPVGTYAVNFAATYRQTGQTLTRIKAISGTVDVTELRSLPASYPGADSDSDSLIIDHWQGGFGILTVTATAVIELQYYAQASLGGTSSLGTPSTEPDTDVETYSRVTILDLATVQGPQGTAGVPGGDGDSAGYDFQFSTGTSGDPGSGKIGFDDVVLADVTEVRVSKTGANAEDLEDAVGTWDSSTSNDKGTLRITKDGAPENYIEVRITGNGVDQTTHWEFPCEYVDDDGTIANADDIAVNFIEKGDIGDPGMTVPDPSGLSDLPVTQFDRFLDKLLAYDASAGALKAFFIPQMAVDVTHPTFGAAGDGTTDDAGAFEAALDYLDSVGGGHLFVPKPASFYRFASGNLPAYNGIHVKGVRGVSILKLDQGVSDQIFLNPDASSDIEVEDFTIEDLVFDGSALGSEAFAASGVAVNGVRRFRAVGCTFKNWTGYGLGLQASPAHPTINGDQTEIWLEDCIFENNGFNATAEDYDGLDIKGAQRIFARGLIGRNNADTGLNFRGQYLNIDGIVCYGNKIGCNLIANALTGSNGPAIANVANTHTYSNSIDGMSFGIGDAADGWSRANFANIVSHGNTAHGFRLSESVTSSGRADVQIANVSCYSNGSNGLNNLLQATRLSVVNGVFEGNTSTGIQTAGIGSTFVGCRFIGNNVGFDETGSAANNRLIGCHFESNITLTHSINGATTILLACTGVANSDNSGLHLPDTDASHDLILKSESNLSAARVLSFITGDANRSLTLGANSSIAGDAMVQGKTSKWIPAAEFLPRVTNGPSRGLTETSTNDAMVDTLDFDTTTQEGATLFYKPPKSWNLGTITFIPYWTCDSGSGGDTVQWLLDAVVVSNDDPLDASWGTAQTSADAVIATGDLHIGPESSAITAGGTPAAADALLLRIRRDVANDNLAADARLLGVEVFFTTNAGNDA